MLPGMFRCPRIFASGKSFLSFISNTAAAHIVPACACQPGGLRIQTTVIANADGATVPGAAVRATPSACGAG